MRKKIVAGNWKMNKTLDDGVELLNEILRTDQLEGSSTNDVLKIIAPPFIHLYTLAAKIKTSSNFCLAAQNCHHEDHGAYTGEVSAAMVRSAGASHVIVGHSERRAYFGEHHQLLAQKANTAIQCGLQVIFCVGEKMEERKSEKHFDVIEMQLEESLFHLKPEDFSKIIIAYEPVWAIGTGLTASAEQAQEIHLFIRGLIDQKYGNAIASSTPILYGGSCNAENAKELFSCKDIDGGLIGGASLKPSDFVKIINSF